MTEEMHPVIGFCEYNQENESADPEAFTFCVACDKTYSREPELSYATIRDTPAFGNKVPYPECFLCNEVIRPEVLELKE